METKDLTFDANVPPDVDDPKKQEVHVCADETELPAKVTGLRVIVAPDMRTEDALLALEKIVECVRKRQNAENLCYGERIHAAVDDRVLFGQLQPLDQLAVLAIQLYRYRNCGHGLKTGDCYCDLSWQEVERELIRLKRKITAKG